MLPIIIIKSMDPHIIQQTNRGQNYQTSERNMALGMNTRQDQINGRVHVEQHQPGGTYQNMQFQQMHPSQQVPNMQFQSNPSQQFQQQQQQNQMSFQQNQMQHPSQSQSQSQPPPPQQTQGSIGSIPQQQLQYQPIQISQQQQLPPPMETSGQSGQQGQQLNVPPSYNPNVSIQSSEQLPQLPPEIQAMHMRQNMANQYANNQQQGQGVGQIPIGAQIVTPTQNFGSEQTSNVSHMKSMMEQQQEHPAQFINYQAGMSMNPNFHDNERMFQHGMQTSNKFEQQMPHQMGSNVSQQPGMSNFPPHQQQPQQPQQHQQQHQQQYQQQ